MQFKLCLITSLDPAPILATNHCTDDFIEAVLFDDDGERIDSATLSADDGHDGDYAIAALYDPATFNPASLACATNVVLHIATPKRELCVSLDFELGN